MAARGWYPREYPAGIHQGREEYQPQVRVNAFHSSIIGRERSCGSRLMVYRNTLLNSRVSKPNPTTSSFRAAARNPLSLRVSTNALRADPSTALGMTGIVELVGCSTDF